MSPTFRSPDWVALSAALITIAVHVVWKLAEPRSNAWFIGGACAFWLGLILNRVCQHPELPEHWGFRRAEFFPTLRACVILFAIAFVAMLAYGWLAEHVSGSVKTLLHLALMLLIYPVWGVIQQFLTLAIVVANLARIPPFRSRPSLVTLVGAGLFALVHFYDWRLAAGTFVLELAVIPLYFRYRNLWPLGLLQGWVGAFFYLWVLNEDLITESLNW